MAAEQLRTFLCRLRAVAASNAGDSVADEHLLQRFISQRDAAAFEVLVWRHGGMVLSVCGRLLRRAEDTEDVFQATFLTLARRADSIRNGECLASWLYRVAYRVALRVRSRATREAQQQRSLPLAARLPASQEAASDLQPLLDEEINHLPEKYRAPVILCYLQGKSTEEAGRQLGCPRGTICSRLAWARRRLRSRLARRGLALSAGGLAASLTGGTAQAALVASTVKGAVLFASGQATASALLGPAVALAEGVLRAMVLTKLKMAMVIMLVLGVLGLGAGLSAKGVFADKQGTGDAPVLVRGSGDGVQLPADMASKAGIQVAEIKQRAVARPQVLVFPGSLALDPEHLIRVRCRFAPAEVVELGKPDEKDANRELRPGDKVRKGQLLATLISIDAGSKKSDLFDAIMQLRLDQDILDRAEKAGAAVPEALILNARRTVSADQSAVNRAERTLQAWGIPEQEIEAVRKAAQEAGAPGRKPETEEARKDRLKRWNRVDLHARDHGTIIERNISRHEIVTDNTVCLFQIARVDRLKVLVQVPEDDLPLLEALRPEQRHWSIRAQGAPEAEGVIESIGYLIDPNQHTAVVSGFVDNPEGRLRAGQFVTASVTLPPRAGEVVLPAGAVVEQGREAFVFVQPDPKKLFYEQRRVAVVRRGQEAVHVRARLTVEQERQGFQAVRPGERVVTAGAVELKAILDDLKANASTSGQIGKGQP
jgi:cobalt-zinc-cadmium efflux system membrane fusion protein